MQKFLKYNDDFLSGLSIMTKLQKSNVYNFTEKNKDIHIYSSSVRSSGNCTFFFF